MKKIFYFDNAATTRVDEEISDIVSKYNTYGYFNPSANYADAVSIHNEVEKARERLLRAVGGVGYKVIFLSSGTEGDNLALFGTKKKRGSNVVIAGAEHPAVYNAAMQLKAEGYDLRICPVNERGVVSAEAVSELVDKDTSIVSVMHVNNETGGKNDIKGIVRLVKEKCPQVLIHSDGVQAFGKVPVSLADLGVDLYTVSGHKIGAPKGIAALIVKNGVNLSPVIYGGGQEGGIRSSTENVSGIMAFARCAERAVGELEKNSEKYAGFRRVLHEAVASLGDVKFLSSEEDSPHVFTFAFREVRGEVLQHSLETEGILVGTGSACSARRSHDRIPKALGLGAYANGMVRVSFGRENTLDEVLFLAEKIKEHYAVLKKYVGV